MSSVDTFIHVSITALKGAFCSFDGVLMRREISTSTDL